MTKPESVSDYMRRIGKLGAKMANKKISKAQRRQFGKLGGRPKLSEQERAQRQRERLEKKLAALPQKEKATR